MKVIKQPIPKYFQIYDELLKQLKSGKYKEYDLFPSDTSLVEKYGVSRGTIREAIKLLLQEGYVVREQGKGTFVTFQKIEQNPDRLMGFTELMQKNDMTPSARIIKKMVVDAPPHLMELMQLSDGEQLVRIIRVRLGDEQPLIIERSYFSQELFRPIYDMDLESNSIYELLYKHTNVKLGKADQRIEAISASQSDSRLLKIKQGSPLLLMKRLIQTDKGRFFQYSEDVYRSDRINFSTTTQPYMYNYGLPIELNARGILAPK